MNFSNEMAGLSSGRSGLNLAPEKRMKSLIAQSPYKKINSPEIVGFAYVKANESEEYVLVQPVLVA